MFSFELYQCALFPETMGFTDHYFFTLLVNMIVTLGLAVISLLGVTYLFLVRRYKYWEKRGIVGPKPEMFFGNVKDAILLKCTVPESITLISKKFKDEKYIGMYYYWKPVVLIKDLELVKRITGTEFEHFPDHPDFIGPEKTDSISYSLISMPYSIWKPRRSYFSKLFTPKKMKEYAEDIQIGIKTLMKQIDEKLKEGNDIEMIDFLEQYTTYTVTSTMFGLNVLADEEISNLCKNIAHMFMNPPAINVLKFISYELHPHLFKFLRLRTFPTRHWEVTSKLTDDLIFSRNRSGIVRQDCLNAIMKLLKEGAPNIDKIPFEEAVGHVWSFFIAGSQPTLVGLSHVFFRLAEHPLVQEKVRAEVDSVLEGSKEITYDHVQKMIYLNNVILESQRLMPNFGTLKQTCKKACKIDEKLYIPEYMDVYIDALHIHMDPQYFPEPERFMPERWSNGKSDPSAFMGFGVGPRMCIGKRLAETQMKMTVAAVVSRYLILPGENMKPIRCDPKKWFLTNIPKDGVYLKLKCRDK